MNLPPKDYTKQEQLIAAELARLGLRYDQQVEVYPYTVDFFIPELGMVIEADGIYGHLSSQDKRRDERLLYIYNDDVHTVIHCRATTKKKIKDFLGKFLKD